MNFIKKENRMRLQYTEYTKGRSNRQEIENKQVSQDTDHPKLKRLE